MNKTQLKKLIKESARVTEVKKGSVIKPYAMDRYGEFVVDNVFKNKKGETSYTGKFKKTGKRKEFILHPKDEIVKESVDIKMADKAIADETDKTKKNKLVRIRGKVLHKNP